MLNMPKSVRKKSVMPSGRLNVEEELDKLASCSKARYLSSMFNIIRKYEKAAEQEVEADLIDLEKMEIIDDRGTIRNMEVRKGICMTYYYKTKSEQQVLHKLTSIIETVHHYNDTAALRKERSQKKLFEEEESHISTLHRKARRVGTYCRKNEACKNDETNSDDEWEEAYSSDSSWSDSSGDSEGYNEFDVSDSIETPDENKQIMLMQSIQPCLEESLRKSDSLEKKISSKQEISCNIVPANERNKSLELNYYKLICDEVKNKTLHDTLLQSQVEPLQNSSSNLRAVIKSSVFSFKQSGNVPNVQIASSQSSIVSSDGTLDVNKPCSLKKDQSSSSSIYLSRQSISSATPFSPIKNTINKSTSAIVRKENTKQQSNEMCNECSGESLHSDRLCDFSFQLCSRNNSVPTTSASLFQQNESCHSERKLIRQHLSDTNAADKLNESTAVEFKKPSMPCKDKMQNRVLHSSNDHKLTCSHIQLSNLSTVSTLTFPETSSDSISKCTKDETMIQKYSTSILCVPRKSVSSSSSINCGYSNNLGISNTETPNESNKVMYKESNNRKIDNKMIDKCSELRSHMYGNRKTNSNLDTTVTTMPLQHKGTMCQKKEKHSSLQLKQLRAKPTLQERSCSNDRKNNCNVLSVDLDLCSIASLVRNKLTEYDSIQHKKLTYSNMKVTSFTNGRMEKSMFKTQMAVTVNVPREIFVRNDIEEDALLKFCRQKPTKQLESKKKVRGQKTYC